MPCNRRMRKDCEQESKRRLILNRTEVHTYWWRWGRKHTRRSVCAKRET